MQSREYRINWEMYTPYAGAAGMLLHKNGKFTIGKLNSSLLSNSFLFNRISLSIFICKPIHKTDFNVSVYPLSQDRWGIQQSQNFELFSEKKNI